MPTVWCGDTRREDWDRMRRGMKPKIESPHPKMEKVQQMRKDGKGSHLHNSITYEEHKKRGGREALWVLGLKSKNLSSRPVLPNFMDFTFFFSFLPKLGVKSRVFVTKVHLQPLLHFEIGSP